MSEKAWDLGSFFFIFMLIRTYECKGSNAVFLLENSMEFPMDRGTWQAAVHGVAKSQTLIEHTHTCGGAEKHIPRSKLIPSDSA